MKSALQQRAEAAAARFDGARKPVVIEFAGVPKAGKTTTLNQVRTFLKRCGMRIDVVAERASVCPIRDKKNFNFNVWTACTTLSRILESTQIPPRPDDPDVLILDRGLFDAVNWLAVMERIARIRPSERAVIERFLLMNDWQQRVTGVIVMTASPRTSMAREQGCLPVDGASGSIMNEDVLQQTLETTRETIDRLSPPFRVVTIDTTEAEPRETAERVAHTVLELIEEQLDEKILSLPSDAAAGLFAHETCLDKAAAQTLLDRFKDGGQFENRDVVESDATLVQALPVVVVRNRTGDVLLLKRRERRRDNPLHEKLVIWAGGHVRQEDGENGVSILQCAVRELQEELRISIDAEELNLLGAVWIRAGDRTRRHAAIVFEWRAPADHVAVALSATEFFERRGTALSGTFVGIDELAADVDARKVCEPWSIEIVRRLLPDVNSRQTAPLLL